MEPHAGGGLILHAFDDVRSSWRAANKLFRLVNGIAGITDWSTDGSAFGRNPMPYLLR
jgi:hypothetical protein